MNSRQVRRSAVLAMGLLGLSAVLAGGLGAGRQGAAPAGGTATIQALVLTKAGAPAEGVDVHLDTPGMTDGGNARGDAGPGSQDKAARPALQEFKRVASVKTDKEGKAEFKNVKAGVYRVAVLTGEGRTRAYKTVRIKAGETIKATLQFRD